MQYDHELFKKYLSNNRNFSLTDSIGVQYLQHIVSDRFAYEFEYPAISPNEEYFEWLELLKSVDKAKDKFLFVELGAGYGRWTARAYKACLMNRISPTNMKFILVEGEPQHYQWLQEHLNYNNIPTSCIITKEALMANYDGTGEILVHFQDGLNGVQTAKNWYGQSHIQSINKNEVWMRDNYLGKELLIDRSGIGRVVCETITLETLLGKENSIDLLDMDIQGSEFNVINCSLDFINKKVKKVYISTHSNQIDDAIYQLFNKLGWINIWSFPFQYVGETPYGTVTFGDGIQVWENTNFNY